MKKIILLIAAVTFMAFNINAQDYGADLREQLQYGAKIGLNYSNVYDTQGDQFTADPKLGLAAGGFISIPIGMYLGVQPELLFSQKGFRATGMILGLPYEFKRTTNFIDVPLLIAFKPSSTITILAGPQYSYLIKQKDVYTGGPMNTAQEQEFKNENIRKNILCFLGGIDFNLSNVVLGVRAGWDIQNNNGDGTSTTPRYKNVWYQATLGFRF
jgi:hypothetical protein